MKECILVLDNIRSVENTGSIFRTAEGLGVKEIILVGTTPTPVDRFGRKRADFAKVSLGAEEMISWKYEKETSVVIKELKDRDLLILALEQHPRSKNLQTYKLLTSNFVLIVGNEVEGVSKEFLKAATVILEIPMQGKKESLNVAVATGIALFELLK